MSKVTFDNTFRVSQFHGSASESSPDNQSMPQGFGSVKERARLLDQRFLNVPVIIPRTSSTNRGVNKLDFVESKKR